MSKFHEHVSAACGAWTYDNGDHAHDHCDGRVAAGCGYCACTCHDH